MMGITHGKFATDQWACLFSPHTLQDLNTDLHPGVLQIVTVYSHFVNNWRNNTVQFCSYVV